VDQVGNDINSILGALNDSSELQEFLDNPLIKQDDKKAVMNRILGDSVHPYTRNFVQVLVDRRRVMFLAGICKEFQALLRKLNQTVLAEVTSARELTDEQKHSLREKVLAMTGARQVDLETRIDPELIGGVIIRIGSQVIDASLRGQLRRISLRLNTPA
jgi:F-type H+-transporting ATPase subunit delta